MQKKKSPDFRRPEVGISANAGFRKERSSVFIIVW